MEKVDNMQEQMSNANYFSELFLTLRNNKKEMLEIKNTVQETNSAFDEIADQ